MFRCCCGRIPLASAYTIRTCHSVTLKLRKTTRATSVTQLKCLHGSRGSYSMPKPREFVHNNSETLFLESLCISEQISNSLAGFKLQFCRNYSLTPESEDEFFLSVETSRFYSIPKLENFLNHKAKLIIEIA